MMKEPSGRFEERLLPGREFPTYGIWNTQAEAWIDDPGGDGKWSTINPIEAAAVAAKLNEAVRNSDAFTESMRRLVESVSPNAEAVERLRQGILALGSVEPMDLTAPAEVLIQVPWTTPTTDENVFARTLELADSRDAVQHCRVYWGSHGCTHPRGHSPEISHACDCCTCEQHPDPDPDNPNGEPSCVAAPPYYGEHTRFFGEDAEALGLPLVAAS